MPARATAGRGGGAGTHRCNGRSRAGMTGDDPGMHPAPPAWHTDAYPELRPGPPWVTDEMVALQPSLAAPLLDPSLPGAGELAGALRDSAGSVAVVGCGTSEHGAMAIAALLADALGDGTWPPRVAARQALDAVRRPQRGGVCVGVSHDGGTRATTLALEAARAAGVRTALITGVPEPAAAPVADTVITTPVHDDSWCHTVAYTSAILTGAALARELGATGVDAGAARAVLEAALEAQVQDGGLADCARILVAGAGADEVTARELALKIAEGARIPTVAYQLETLLHGHLAGEDATTGAVLVDFGGDARTTRRADLAADALAALGMRVVRLGDARDPGGLPDALARLLAGAIALQKLTLALAAARGVNPDLIRREEDPWRAAAGAAEEVADW